MRRSICASVVALFVMALVPVVESRTAVAAVAPTVSGLSPLSGPVAGGTVVTVSGSALGGASRVTFGGVPGTGFGVVSETLGVAPVG